MTDITQLRRAEPLAAQLAEQMRGLIASGAWPVGEKVPGEHELVRILGVSRNTVREAMRALVHVGLLEPRAGDGTYVRARTELQAVLRRRVESERPEDVFEVRATLEERAAALAVRNATAADLERMRDALDARDRAPDSVGFIAADLEFHLAVVEAAGNPLLADIYRNLDRVVTYSVGACGGTDHEALRSTWPPDDEHRALLEAIVSRDPARATTRAAAIAAKSRGLHDS